MTDKIHAAIEASREREVKKDCDKQFYTLFGGPFTDGCRTMEPRFRDALAVAVEVLKYEAHQSLPVREALAEIKAILEGRKA